MFSIAGLPFSGVAKNVAKLQTLFETCKPFGQFFFRFLCSFRS